MANVGLNLPVALMILDGFGIDEPNEGNAIANARTPFIDELFSTCPHIQLSASGEAVGLPDGQMGNSEVGHLNIGAGRIVFQELTRINRACEDGSLRSNQVIVDAFQKACASGSVLHLMGLLSDGGVHSNNAHLYALMRLAVEMGVSDVAVHCFMDGRDVPPTSGIEYVRELEDVCASLSTEASRCRIASIEGRYYAMDRDNRWDRVERAYNTVVAGEACASSNINPVRAMELSYDAGVTDEFIEPICFDNRGMKDGDVVLFFNFRPDRAREITRALTFKDFDGFARVRRPEVHYVCLTQYDESFTLPVAFPKFLPENVLADVVSNAGLRQYHIAETEKYAHVTFFLNGGKEEPKENETRKLIPSPKVATYDLKPEMSALEVAETLSKAIDENESDVYIVNFANCDMVGHTGVLSAAIQAVEAVDTGVKQVIQSLKKKNGIALLTADHGNADKMIAVDGSSHTAHTTAPVPLILIDYSDSNRDFVVAEGALCDLAPTLLSIIGLEIPEDMTGTVMVR